MLEFKAQVLVCTRSEGAPDRRHCGDKGGMAVLEAFRQARTRLGLEKEVKISKAGCTSQHALNGEHETAVTIYGPKPELGGTWYKLTESDVEEVLREHVQNGRVVKHLLNSSICVKF